MCFTVLFCLILSFLCDRMNAIVNGICLCSGKEKKVTRTISKKSPDYKVAYLTLVSNVILSKLIL